MFAARAFLSLGDRFDARQMLSSLGRTTCLFCLCARLSEAHTLEFSDREGLRLAGMPVAVLPRFDARWGDVEIEPVAVGEPIRFSLWLCLLDLQIVQQMPRHSRYLLPGFGGKCAVTLALTTI